MATFRVFTNKLTPIAGRAGWSAIEHFDVQANSCTEARLAVVGRLSAGVHIITHMELPEGETEVEGECCSR